MTTNPSSDRQAEIQALARQVELAESGVVGSVVFWSSDVKLLLAELARVRQERDTRTDERDAVIRDANKLRAERDTLQREIGTLREQIEELAHGSHTVAYDLRADLQAVLEKGPS